MTWFPLVIKRTSLLFLLVMKPEFKMSCKLLQPESDHLLSSARFIHNIVIFFF